jgi:outer membrane lipoprotein SlyB
MTILKLFTGAALAASLALAGCQTSSGPQTASQARNHEFSCVAGTIGGAVIGGLVGSTIGGGRGTVLATAAGIGGGGYLGNRLAC